MKWSLVPILFVVVFCALGCRTMATKPIYFTCPEHPSVKVAAAGNCPLCAAKLVPAFSETDSGTAAPCGAANCSAQIIHSK